MFILEGAVTFTGKSNVMTSSCNNECKIGGGTNIYSTSSNLKFNDCKPGDINTPETYSGTADPTKIDVDLAKCAIECGNQQHVLAAIIDGTKNTWDYENPIWTDDTVYDVNGERKTSAFNTMKSNTIRVSFEHGNCTEQFDYEHNLDMTLKEIFSSDEQINKSPGRNDWIRLGCGDFPVQDLW